MTSRQVGVCPHWCQVEHGLDVDVDELREHRRRIAQLRAPLGTAARHERRDRVVVEVVAVDNLDEATAGPAEIAVRVGDAITAAEARQLALGLLDAIDLLDGGGCRG